MTYAEKLKLACEALQATVRYMSRPVAGCQCDGCTAARLAKRALVAIQPVKK